MKYISLLAVVAAGLTSACTVKTERTVVERPVPVAAPSVVYVEPAPGPAVVYVPR